MADTRNQYERDWDEERPLPRREKRSRLTLDEVFPEAEPISAKSTRPIDRTLVSDARIPPTFWKEGWVLREISDLAWRELTLHAPGARFFPATLRKDHHGHPGYVLEEVGTYAVRICPCTSRKMRGPYIPEQAVLEETGFRLEKESHLVLNSLSTLSRNRHIFFKIPKFLGIFPQEKLHHR